MTDNFVNCVAYRGRLRYDNLQTEWVEVEAADGPDAAELVVLLHLENMKVRVEGGRFPVEVVRKGTVEVERFIVSYRVRFSLARRTSYTVDDDGMYQLTPQEYEEMCPEDWGPDRWKTEH